MTDQMARAARFRALHERSEPFLLPNPWDAGTARLLAGLGFEALATTSLGVANMLGGPRAGRQDILDNCRVISAATPLPVNADLENGYAAEPAQAAKMIEDACACGAAGASIEDGSGDPRAPIYDFGLAVERVHAAVEATRSLPVPLVLTARAENLLYGVADLDDTIRRLQAFESAGADVLYAPGLRTLDQMRAVVSSVGRPVNVVMGFADPAITLEQLAEIGVRRVSIGGALSRLALRSFLDGARQMRDGRFGFVTEMASISELHQAFERGRGE
ncbi:isocitrate lyase/phosphoenolpyruvate mutase family protein [Nonomuraea turkmeniaca]|uniref:Isocitrate lyase/phosphoenolpyruvate mutase family protein n=1 Tax=Nonomuraea turkmeniaca TaxID=103838 RepID=A0A5S4FUS6_9ACTN|nr:isocitrate lyase/phosphoenolpyruvate mutase family protein [Nonomuraea turkmeniaca]TMR23871.1 isocitrate lyase/phosphoenolpyruvate mutase family protein [Nonomuraea turkmeniaca]